MFGTSDGDYAIVSGIITIDPPLDWFEYKAKHHFIDAQGAVGTGAGPERSRQLKLSIHETVSSCECRNLRQHTHFTRTATGVIPVGAGQSWYATRLVEDLQELVDAFPDRTFSDYLEVSPSHTTEPSWRLYVINGVASKVYPRLVWPDIFAQASVEAK